MTREVIDKKDERLKLMLEHLVFLMQSNPGETAFQVDMRYFQKLRSNPFTDSSKIEIALDILSRDGLLDYTKESRLNTYTEQDSVAFYGRSMTRTDIFYNIHAKKSVVELKRYSQSTKSFKRGKENIRSISIFEDPERDDGKFLVLINDDYLNTSVEPKKDGKYWGVFLEAAKEGDAFANDPKRTADYFNTNKNCSLYTSRKYNLTKILDYSSKRVSFSRSIKIKLLTIQSFTRAKNQQLKALKSASL